MFEEEKAKVTALCKTIKDNSKLAKIDEKKKQLKKLHQKQVDPNLYSDIGKMKKLNIEIKKLENTIAPWEKLLTLAEDVQVLIDMAAEAGDISHQEEIQTNLEQIQTDYNALELRQLFTDPDDFSNSYLSIHPGAGGTESCDWAMMLYRMYNRWAEEQGLKCKVVEFQPGEEAGIKSATLFIEGDYAHGYLKSEVGVHRLVRISPFDANKRRHTSFCSIYSTPEVEDDLEIIIPSAEIKIDTYRSSGAGGQHVNTTDSAVRITHLPTNIVVTCQAERSQIQNKERAMKMLKSKLHDHRQTQKEANRNANAVEKKKIEWGSQIRSYIFHPYNLIKDHRTEYETGNTQAVIDGQISDFMQAWLKL